VWGRDPGKTATVAGQLGTRAYDDVAALIADVDAIAVALPPDVQAGIAAEAAEAGRHLLLDKPLSFTTADADRVVKAVDAAGSSSRVFFTARFTPETEEWLQQLAADGDWDGAHVTMLGNIYREGSPYAGSVWRQERGALWDIGPHALSQLVPVLGPVSRVVAAAGRGDTVSLAMSHASGGSSTATLSLTAPEASRHDAMYFHGPRGISHKPTGGASYHQAYDNALSELLTSIAEGTTADRCDVRFGRDVVAVLESAERQLAGDAAALAASHRGTAVPV
jgi:predicted dehydrogenase